MDSGYSFGKKQGNAVRFFSLYEPKSLLYNLIIQHLKGLQKLIAELCERWTLTHFTLKYTGYTSQKQ